jgi:hypothetical protein
MDWRAYEAPASRLPPAALCQQPETAPTRLARLLYPQIAAEVFRPVPIATVNLFLRSGHSLTAA